MVDLFTGHPRRAVVSRPLPFLENVKRSPDADDISGPRTKHLQTGIHLRLIAQDEVQNDVEVRLHDSGKCRTQVIAVDVVGLSALRMSRRFDIVTNASREMWNAGSDAVACSALAMLDLPALVGPCKTIAVGVMAPNIDGSIVIRERVMMAGTPAPTISYGRAVVTGAEHGQEDSGSA